MLRGILVSTPPQTQYMKAIESSLEAYQNSTNRSCQRGGMESWKGVVGFTSQLLVNALFNRVNYVDYIIIPF